MNILYTLNDKFVPQVSAGMCSICENNKDIKKIDFYLMSLNISKKNKKKLREFFTKKYSRDVYFIELDDLSSYFDFDFDTNGWNPIVLARLLLDKLLPKKMDRVLYLDGDTIVRGNLSDLYSMDMQDKTIAASIEPTIDKKRKHSLELDGLPYFNAGVLLVDLKNWRKKNVGNKIISYYKENDGKLFANDQDAINGSMKNDIIVLNPKYNYYNIFYQYSYKFLAKLCDFQYISKSEFEEAKNNPIIVHYLGEERPWRVGNRHKYKGDYIYYLSLTPWANQNIEQGWKLYFICWNTFNFLIKPFPMIRYKIINGLIPLFMKIRSKKIKK